MVGGVCPHDHTIWCGDCTVCCHRSNHYCHFINDVMCTSYSSLGNGKVSWNESSLLQRSYVWHCNVNTVLSGACVFQFVVLHSTYARHSDILVYCDIHAVTVIRGVVLLLYHLHIRIEEGSVATVLSCLEKNAMIISDWLIDNKRDVLFILFIFFVYIVKIVFVLCMVALPILSTTTKQFGGENISVIC